MSIPGNGLSTEPWGLHSELLCSLRRNLLLQLWSALLQKSSAFMLTIFHALYFNFSNNLLGYVVSNAMQAYSPGTVYVNAKSFVESLCPTFKRLQRVCEAWTAFIKSVLIAANCSFRLYRSAFKLSFINDSMSLHDTKVNETGLQLVRLKLLSRRWVQHLRLFNQKVAYQSRFEWSLEDEC